MHCPIYYTVYNTIVEIFIVRQFAGAPSVVRVYYCSLCLCDFPRLTCYVLPDSYSHVPNTCRLCCLANGPTCQFSFPTCQLSRPSWRLAMATSAGSDSDFVV